jgi:hypothetical protein
MGKEDEQTNNFESDESELDLKFEWAKENIYENWFDVEGGRIRVRTEIAYFKLPEEGSQENNTGEGR